MDLDKTKSSAITLLKMSKTVQDVASELSVPTTLVEEWADSAEITLAEAALVDVEVTRRATEILSTEIITPDTRDKLETALQEKTLELIKIMTVPAMADYEQIQAIEKAAKALSSIQTALFKSGPAVAIQNNTNTQENSTSELSTFKEALKC